MIVALSVRQPFAEAIARGRKKIEVRPWSTTYRGPLLIVSGRVFDPDDFDRFEMSEPFKAWLIEHQRGVTVARVQLVDCRRMQPGDEPLALRKVDKSLFAWVLAKPEILMPHPVRGRQSLFRLGDELVQPCNGAPRPLEVK